MRNKIKPFLDGQRITPYQFWKRTGIAQRTAYDLYNLPEQYPARDVMEKICSTFRVQPGELLEWVEDGSPADDGDRPDDDVPAPEQATRRRRTRRAGDSTERALRDDSTEGWQEGDTFTHGGIDWRVKSVGNRYLRLTSYDSGEEEGGFWDTQTQQLQRQGKTA